MDSRRLKHQQASRSKANAICNKHPKHQQSPGVCSICLRERLSQILYTNTSRVKRSDSCSSSSLSSLSSSDEASSYSSPVEARRGPISSSMIFLKGGKSVLMKSRSDAAVTRRREEDELNVEKKKKKSHFWWKLLGTKSKLRIDESLARSRTMREKVATMVH